MKTATIIATLCIILGYGLSASANTAPNSNIQLIKSMQKTLLVEQKGTASNINRFYNKDLRVNNQPRSLAQVQHHLASLYAADTKTAITYHYFTVSNNNVSWYEDIASTNKHGVVQHHTALELAEINHGKISRIYAAGS